MVLFHELHELFLGQPGSNLSLQRFAPRSGIDHAGGDDSPHLAANLAGGRHQPVEDKAGIDPGAKNRDAGPFRCPFELLGEIRVLEVRKRKLFASGDHRKTRANCRHQLLHDLRQPRSRGVQKHDRARSSESLFELAGNLEGDRGNADKLTDLAPDEQRAWVDRTDELELGRGMSNPRYFLPDEAQPHDDDWDGPFKGSTHRILLRKFGKLQRTPVPRRHNKQGGLR